MNLTTVGTTFAVGARPTPEVADRTDCQNNMPAHACVV
jgi:hypothetical protein